MTTGKKKRLSMLDSLAQAGAPVASAASTSMMSSNRALRAARDAVDSHRVWELDPEQIRNTRIEDRLTPGDIAELREAIETNGQSVPILVRRDPDHADHYLLVYGRRRLEAIRSSDKVEKIRAIVAVMDDDQSTRAQISENTARRDLTYIEKALFAKELLDSGFGNQTQVAEVLTASKSAISMALAIVDMIGSDLIRAIGPAPGIGRPRWEALGKALEERACAREPLIEIAERVHTDDEIAMLEGAPEPEIDISVQAFAAVERALPPAPKFPPQASASMPAQDKPRRARQPLRLDGKTIGAVKRTSAGISLDLRDSAFADWVETEAQELIDELHARWQARNSH